MPKGLIFLFLFLFLFPSTLAFTSQATMQVDDFQPFVESITTDQNDNQVNIKIKVRDPNNYQDIQNVQVKIVYFDGTEQIYPRFGENYQKAIFDSGQDTEAHYTYTFTMDPDDKIGFYRVKVKVNDKKSFAESSITYRFPSTEPTALTGAFLRIPSETKLTDIFKSFFSWVKGWFS